jgi:hypothetical protein
MATVPSRIPNALAALTPKVTGDNGGPFGGLLQPKHQSANSVDPAAISAALVAAGIMRGA